MCWMLGKLNLRATAGQERLSRAPCVRDTKDLDSGDLELAILSLHFLTQDGGAESWALGKPPAQELGKATQWFADHHSEIN